MRLKPPGMMLTMLRRPEMVFPINCKGDARSPVNEELQAESGVLTISLQSANSEERRNCRGSNKIEKIPWLLVVAVEITLPTVPHSSCRVASTTYKHNIYMVKLENILLRGLYVYVVIL